MGQNHSKQESYQSYTILDEIKNQMLSDTVTLTTRSGTAVWNLHLHRLHPPIDICLLRVDGSCCATYTRIKRASESEAQLSGRLSDHKDFKLIIRTIGMTASALQQYICCCYMYIGVSVIDFQLEDMYVVKRHTI